MIYLDNAATTWPKPESVYLAVDHAMRECGGNPGRSGHSLSLAAGKIIDETRYLLSQFFHAEEASRVVFTQNCTDALNLAIKGILKPGDHAITGSMEHNSVARPLEALKQTGVEITKLPVSPEYGLNPQDVKAAIKPNTKLVVLSHASNVAGTVNPIAQIGAITREAGVFFLVDAAQSAGILPIDVQEQHIDLLAFPGHKGLFGPQGTGGLYIRTGVDLETMKQGGTGTQSRSLLQPSELPEKYESGTLNTPGIAGLGAGVKFLLSQGVEAIMKKEEELTNRLTEGLSNINGIRLYGPTAGMRRTGVVSFNIEGMDSMDVAMILSQSFDIAVRAGLHCAPDAHETLGTLETGTVRASLSVLNTPKDIDAFLEAVSAIAQG